MKKNEKIQEFVSRLIVESDPSTFNSLCDDFFQYSYSSVESMLTESNSNPELYLENNLEEQALNTSWYDYYQMICLSKKLDITVLDIGSAYSKGTLLSLVLNFSNFTSVEVVSERINWAKKVAASLGLNTNKFIVSDSLEIDLSQFDVLYIYQPTGRFLTKLLDKVTRKNNQQYIWAVESHGDLIPRLDSDSRLTKKKVQLSFHAARHDRNLYSYSVIRNETSPFINFERALYSNRFVEVRDYNSIYGEFRWITKAEKGFVDFQNKTIVIELNGKRINVKEEDLSNFSFPASIGVFVMKYINSKKVIYKNKEQRIIRIITSPKNALELSSSGKVYEEQLS